jgi:hypothetical protein
MPSPAQTQLPPLESRPCSIVDLTDTTCRWPMWDDSTSILDRLYCGGVTLPDGVYCPHHMALACLKNQRESRHRRHPFAPANSAKRSASSA